MADYHTPASDMLTSLLTTGGCIQNQCPACGRTLVATGTYPADELDMLRQEAEQSEGKIVLIDTDSLSIANMEHGGHLVLDCPCNNAGRMETFIWKNRDIITQYLRARIAAERAALETTSEVLNG